MHLPQVCRATDPGGSLLTGALEPQWWYAIAKIAGIQLCGALRAEHGFDALSLMPTNLYGPGDNYHPTNSHVMAALLRRFHQAAEENLPEVSCWGSGEPRREFLHVDDLAAAAVHCLSTGIPATPMPRHVDGRPLEWLNVGCGDDLSIKQLARRFPAIASTKAPSTGTQASRMAHHANCSM